MHPVGCVMHSMHKIECIVLPSHVFSSPSPIFDFLPPSQALHCHFCLALPSFASSKLLIVLHRIVLQSSQLVTPLPGTILGEKYFEHFYNQGSSSNHHDSTKESKAVLPSFKLNQSLLLSFCFFLSVVFFSIM